MRYIFIYLSIVGDKCGTVISAQLAYSLPCAEELTQKRGEREEREGLGSVRLH